MANLGTVMKEEVTRLARKAQKSELSFLRKAGAQYRRDIADLKRQVGELQRKVAYFESQEKRRTEAKPGPVPRGTRFSAKGLASHREKLGLSASEYGKLAGVSGQSVYLWEQGKARPRDEQLAKLVAVRGLGVRDAHRKLEMLDD